MIGSIFFLRMNLSLRETSIWLRNEYRYPVDDDDEDDGESLRGSSLCAPFGEVMVRQRAETESQQTLTAVAARWRRNERTNEQATSYPTGQLTKPAKRNPSTGRAEPGPSVPRLSGFCSSLFLSLRSPQEHVYLKIILRILFIVSPLCCVTFSAGSRSACDVDDNRYRLPKGLGSCKQCQFSFAILV